MHWTALYRRRHKKGQSKEIQKRTAVQIPEGHAGASLADRMAERNTKPEVRKAQKEPAIQAARDTKEANKHLTRQQWLLLGLPRRWHLSKRW
ncbi:unnamed protein product [Gulo gulo]|uniref:Uncharacterized protein n=1 Tax=Gulo gulo TaxID=48420 RepID=A0A9X9LK73_GULGU|nr:unnamed protein product [Gulo gulo]